MPPRLEHDPPFVGTGVAVMTLATVPQYDSTRLTERDYRFFNFAFACVLYNVWRWWTCW